MKKHWFGPSGKNSKGLGHPIMYGKPKPCVLFDVFPEGGGYPKGFLEWAFEKMNVDNPEEVLHLCSGSIHSGITVDIRPEKNPTILADCRNVPLPNESIKFILVDPPYSIEYAKNLYNTASVYPTPFQILKESTRLLKIGGKVGLLHFQIPMFRKPLRLLGVWGISQGLGYNIRAWSLFQKV